MKILVIVLAVLLITVTIHDYGQWRLLDKLSDKYYVSQKALKSIMNYLARSDT